MHNMLASVERLKIKYRAGVCFDERNVNPWHGYVLAAVAAYPLREVNSSKAYF